MSLLRQLQRYAAVQPGRTALVWPGGTLDYAGLVSAIELAMQDLAHSGVRVLAIAADNGPGWVVLDIAALELGLCVVPLPAFFSTGQIRHVIATSVVEAVVTDDPHGLRERLGGQLRPGARAVSAGPQSMTWLTAAVEPARSAAGRHGIHKITFTSGTTGEPKGVLLSWQQMRPVVGSLAAAAGMSGADCHLALMPLAVLLDNVAGVYVTLWAGGQVALWPLADVGLSGSSGVNGKKMAKALGQAGATTAIFTPQTLQAVVEALERHRGIRLCLRFAAVGGAPVSPRLLQRAARVGLPVYEGYGLSECASVVCLNTPQGQRTGSVGRPLAHVRLTVDDGEVVVHGPGFAGYLGDADGGTAAWRTGDLGELDDDGYLHLYGRRRNLFITAFGRNVAPEWVERELTLEPSIAQVAVFGEARPRNVAVVLPADGATNANVDAALARANAGLPDYARVAHWVRADAPFSPANGLLTGTGRPRRDAIWQHYAAAIESFYREVGSS